MVRESLWGFPILVAIHIMGLTLSVARWSGLDLRLLGGAWSAIGVAAYSPDHAVDVHGFAMMFITGGMLLAGFATAAYDNVYFRLKVLGLALAAVNAFFYHRFTERRIAEWDDAAAPPMRARLAGLISICVWAGVIMAGRMMSYTMF
jgi:hypothetical protein